jgi:hypothetical protein
LFFIEVLELLTNVKLRIKVLMHFDTVNFGVLTDHEHRHLARVAVSQLLRKPHHETLTSGDCVHVVTVVDIHGLIIQHGVDFGVNLTAVHFAPFAIKGLSLGQTFLVLGDGVLVVNDLEGFAAI